MAKKKQPRRIMISKFKVPASKTSKVMNPPTSNPFGEAYAKTSEWEAQKAIQDFWENHGGSQ